MYKHIIIYGVSMIIADSMPVACVYDIMLFSITQRNLPFAIWRTIWIDCTSGAHARLDAWPYLATIAAPLEDPMVNTTE